MKSIVILLLSAVPVVAGYPNRQVGVQVQSQQYVQPCVGCGPGVYAQAQVGVQQYAVPQIQYAGPQVISQRVRVPQTVMTEQQVERTVMVPQTVTETVQVPMTTYTEQDIPVAVPQVQYSVPQVQAYAQSSCVCVGCNCNSQVGAYAEANVMQTDPGVSVGVDVSRERTGLLQRLRSRSVRQGIE